MRIEAVVTVKGHAFDGKGPEIVSRELTAAMYEATAYLEKTIKPFTPQGVYGAQGGLVSTIHGEVPVKGILLVKGVVAHGSKYGDVIEMGRTPGKGMPPEGSLVRWIEVKMGLDAETARKIEFVVRRKIGAKGFQGAHMFEKGFHEGWPMVQHIFEKRGFSIARELER